MIFCSSSIFNDAITEHWSSQKSAKADKIKLLHAFIFNTDERRKREKLRQFSGFSFTVDDTDFLNKQKEITDNFEQLQLILIMNLLNVEVHGTKEEIADHIGGFNRYATFKETSKTEIEDNKPEDKNTLSSSLPCKILQSPRM